MVEKYTKTIKAIEKIIGRILPETYIIGGGRRNSLLCQLIANTTSLPIYAGPVEATSLLET